MLPTSRKRERLPRCSGCPRQPGGDMDDTIAMRPAWPLAADLTRLGRTYLPPPRPLDPAVAAMVAASVFGLGLLADLLFNGAALGVNLPLWLAALTACYVAVARKAGFALDRERLALISCSLVLAC